ncbi:MAG: argininosuccinate synthase [Puniceicoccales bacterium]|nr:argininosuccinate synthase [Puniceicoccales bacterium]
MKRKTPLRATTESARRRALEASRLTSRAGDRNLRLLFSHTIPQRNLMKIVLAYSGGLDTSVIVKWLKETYSAEIVTFAADLGQEEELKGLDKKARATGASKHYTLDLVEDFARDYIFPMVRANAIYEGQYYLGTSIARPLIAKAQVEIAKKERADTVAHGATGKGNDQCRFELSYMALAPDLNIVAPWKIDAFREEFPGRAEMIAYCQKHKIPVEASLKKPYSMDRNLLHISYEAGILEDPWFDPNVAANKAMFKLSVSPEDAPDKPEYVELEFVKGDCVAVNGKKLTPGEVMRVLNKLGGKHGVGRVDIVENRFVGMKSRGVYETPGGTILTHAHRQIETLTLDRDLSHLRDSLIPKYAELIYNGFWFAPERECLQAFIDKSQEFVTGLVRLKLYKGNIVTCGRKSKYSLYDENIASMEGVKSWYNQSDATGFIRLNGLRLRARAKSQGAPKYGKIKGL